MKPSRIGWKFLFTIVGLMGLFLPIYAFGQQGGLAITDPKVGDIYLSLGMPESIVMEKLKGFPLTLI